MLVGFFFGNSIEGPAFSQLSWTTPAIIDTSTSSLTQQLCSFTASHGSVRSAAWVDYFEGGCYGIYETSTDQGLSWERHIAFTNSGGFFKCIRDLLVDNRAYVWIAWSYYPDEFSDPEMRLSRSTDGGNTFEVVFVGQEGANVFGSQLATDLQNNIYLLWDDAFLTLTRFANGDATQRIDTIIPTDTLLVDPIVSLAVDEEYRAYCVWEGSYYDGDLYEILFCTVLADSGTNFSQTVRVDTSNTPLPWGGIAQQQPVIQATPAGHLFVTYRKVLQVNNEGIFLTYSVDNGQSFMSPVSVAEVGSNSTPDLAIDSLAGINLVWDSPAGLSFCRSTDGGMMFGDPEIIGAANGKLAVDADGVLGVVFGSTRLYYTSASLLSSVPDFAEPISSPILFNNYPNPFNPSTTIQFSVSSSGWVTVEIFSLLGQRVEELSNSYLSPGLHSIIWEPGGNLASGPYFCQLRQQIIGGQTFEASQMILYQK